MKPVDLNIQRWRRLVIATGQAVRFGKVADLEKLATGMRDAPSPAGGAGLAACNTLRWGCLWFAHADAAERAAIGPSLLIVAERVARLLGPKATPPEAAAMAQPREPLQFLPDPAPEPSWLRRADCGG